MRPRAGVEQAGESDLGCQRQNNEDRYSYWEPDSDADFRLKGRLAIVADGMGGYEGGQEASRIAVETIEQTYAASPQDPRTNLISGFRAAHQSILEHARQNPVFHNMGTTSTAIVVLDKNLYYAHVGDSRLYLVRNGKIGRLTRDHSYVGRLVEQGIILPEEAESHPQRNILTAALGAGAEISPESPESPISLESGDILLLCTDGLWSVVREAEILAAVSEEAPESACRRLVRAARAVGAPDNVTVQVLRLA